MPVPARLHAAVRGRGEETASERRARALIELVTAGAAPLTTARIRLETGFTTQATAIAMETLKAVGWVEKVWDADLRIWQWALRNPAGYTPPAERPPREDRLYTVAEAAVATGLTETAIRRRVERRTLFAVRGGDRGRLVITHEALLRAGLIDRAVPMTLTCRRIWRMVEDLRGDPNRPRTVEELRQHTGASRQVCEIALIVLRAAGLVAREFRRGYGQYTWTWAHIG